MEYCRPEVPILVCLSGLNKGLGSVVKVSGTTSDHSKLSDLFFDEIVPKILS